jgi:hypothetical protein
VNILYWVLGLVVALYVLCNLKYVGTSKASIKCIHCGEIHEYSSQSYWKLGKFDLKIDIVNWFISNHKCK